MSTQQGNLRVLLPVEVTDDLMTPLRMLMLPTTVTGATGSRRHVSIDLTFANLGVVECIVSEQQLFANESPLSPAYGDLSMVKMEMISKMSEVADSQGMDKALMEYSKPCLPALATETWEKIATFIDDIPIVDPAASAASCGCSL